jgi:ABC-type glycerol-3-phosphate transport system substrate-binding protein
MYFVHPDHPPMRLTRRDYNDWTLAVIEFYGGPFLDENTTDYTITPDNVAGINVLIKASVSGVFDADCVGQQFKLRGDYIEYATISGADEWTDPIIVDAGEEVVMSLTGSWTATSTHSGYSSNNILKKQTQDTVSTSISHN